MPTIPLGKDAYERADNFQPATRLLNLYLEEDKQGLSPDGFNRLQRPGLAAFANFGSAPIRAVYQEENVQSGQPIFVSGTGVYVTDGVTNEQIATVGDDNQIAAICGAYERIGIVTDGKFYASHPDTGNIAEVEVPDLKIPVWVDSINSYFVIACSDGTFFWMEPSAVEIDPLDFATAESSPDGLVAVKRLGDELLFFGRSTVEVWQTTGSADAPFTRSAGRLHDKGCLAGPTISSFDNSLIWISEDNIVFRHSNVPTRISTHAIEEALRNASGFVSAFTFTHDAHAFYVVRIPGQGSFAFDASTGTWCEFGTYGETEWKPHVCIHTREGVFLGDSASGQAWLLDPSSNTDAGTAIERLATATIPIAGKPVRNDSLTIYAGSSANTTLQVRWYDSGEEAGSWTDVALQSPSDNPSILRLGRAFQPLRTYEVRCIEDVQLRLSGATLNEHWRTR